MPEAYGVDFFSTWRAMAELTTDGPATSVGVSNFEPAHLEPIIAETGVMPAVNQIEVHPRFGNDAARKASAERDVSVEAWTPQVRTSLWENPALAATGEPEGGTPSKRHTIRDREHGARSH